MRYSRQRELIFKKVAALSDHPTAEEIYDVASRESPGLSLGTVYRNLNVLADAGKIRRVSVPGHADRFDHTLRQHSHLYCTRCGSVTDVQLDDDALMRIIRDGAAGAEDYSLTLFGLCPECCKNGSM
jgi:Fe2+ or Zn2+ uptake regulation protein